MSKVQLRRCRWRVYGPCVVLCLLVAVGVSGCGGSEGMGDVSGVVTLDGEPLENAFVNFQPAQGRPSQARTDSDGRYELYYTRAQSGALQGRHKVTISTYDEDAGRPELLPMKYNANTELTAQVDAGHNALDFALDSQGEMYEGE